MKKKVLIFIDSLQCGGAEKSLISMLPILDNTRMQIEVLLGKRGGVFEQYVPENIRIIDFHQQVHTLLFRLYQTIFSLRLRWNRLIRRQEHGAETRWKTMNKAYAPLAEHYDIAIAYQQGFPTYYIADKVSADKKIAWANVDLQKAGYCPQYNRPFYNQYDTVVAVSANLQKMLADDGFVPSDRTTVIQDILNVALIREMATLTDFHEQPSSLTLVTVGRMVYQKGYDIAVETANLLRKQGLDFHWYFVGDGAMRREVENLIRKRHLESRITLLGEQANPYPFMAAADIYVQTSRFEGFGITLAEARIVGKPVISTNFPVVYDQITDGQNGLIADMTPDSIAEKIMLLARDTRVREHITHNISLERNNTAEVESAKINQLIRLS